jgi:DNA-binding transcriptional MerR regulator
MPSTRHILKDNGQTGFTIKSIKEYLDSLETTQTSKLHYSHVSYVAEHPLDQLQIDLVYMNKN